MISKILHNKYLIGAAIIILLLFYRCPFQFITGLPCPGCNMKTSLYYLLHGNIELSLYYHALCILTIILLSLAFLCRKNKRIVKLILIIWCLSLVLYYVLRMIYIFPEAPMNYYDKSLLGGLYEKAFIYH